MWSAGVDTFGAMFWAPIWRCLDLVPPRPPPFWALGTEDAGAKGDILQTWTLHSFCIFRGHRPPDCTLVSRLLTPPPQGLLHAPQSAHSPHVPAERAEGPLEAAARHNLTTDGYTWGPSSPTHIVTKWLDIRHKKGPWSLLDVTIFSEPAISHNGPLHILCHVTIHYPHPHLPSGTKIGSLPGPRGGDYNRS